MTEKVSTLEVRQKLGDLFNRVALRHDQFIIERKGKLLAALIPIERLEQMQRAARGSTSSAYSNSNLATFPKTKLIRSLTKQNISPSDVLACKFSL
jgi:PHD/YefM family antitoxin component YafN of YafNO toxin-antitoxin module